MSEQRCDGSDFGACSPDQREAALDGLAQRGSALHAELLRAVVAADDAGDFKADGMLSIADWLAYRYALPAPVARLWVKVAHELEEMPRVRAAYATGNVSFEQVAQALSWAKPGDDRWLADVLPTLGYAEVEAMAKQRRRLRRGEADEARRRRHLYLRPDRDGHGSRLSGFLPTEEAAIVSAALDRRAEAAGPDPETGVWRPHEQRAADALRDMCADDLADGAAGSAHPDASMVVVHVPASTVGLAPDGEPTDGNATIAGEPIVPAAVARMLCDTKIEFHIDDPDGRTVGVRRASRNPPPWLRRRVLYRDGHRCRWPGCNRPIRHLHHMQHWTRDGPTDASNLIGVCWHHHHLLHEGGWNAKGDADGYITLVGPHGRSIDSRAGPVAA